MKRITFTYDNIGQFYALGDTHIGAVNTDLKLLQKHINEIDKFGLPWVHLGDWVDAITPKDRRYNVSERIEAVLDSYVKAEEMFEPIAKQCIAILSGNHGSHWSKQEGNMIRLIAKRWDVPYLGYCGLINYKTAENWTHKIWLHHGAGGGRKRGAKAIRLQEWSQFVDADLYLQGHTHTYQNFADEVVTFSGVKTRYFANVPGYIRSYCGVDGYVEELGLPPQPIRCLSIVLNKKKITVEPVFT